MTKRPNRVIFLVVT